MRPARDTERREQRGPNPLRGLLFAIAFCALSLLLADGLASFVVYLDIANPADHQRVLNAIMSVMFALYFFIAPGRSGSARARDH